MPTFYVDLDNTLADRNAAFRGWAVDYLAERGADPGLIDAMVAADREGLGRKQDTIDDITALLDLDEATSAGVLAAFRAGIVERLGLVEGAERALRRLRDAGWPIVIVSNGTAQQQTAKIERLGLAPLVDAWVISGAEGVEKPDPALFRIAAERVGRPLSSDDWMVGDSAESDVAGARAAGIGQIWFGRGRSWTSTVEPPTAIARDWDEVVATVLGAS
ncbi:HAD family hydrolase [Aestuariimicrobium soli]|uniref:HAD family hydrolase n=1 Tax=Aestuariimicrobium soli TaxID=2035834 RepID=UPI003EB79A61